MSIKYRDDVNNFQLIQVFFIVCDIIKYTCTICCYQTNDMTRTTILSYSFYGMAIIVTEQ